MLKVKNEVRPKSLVIVAAFVNAALEMGLFKTLRGDMLITSALDGVHKRNSAHYAGLAVDLRTKNFPGKVEKFEFVDRVKARLGDRYDVILEDLDGPNEHLHVELDPSRALPDEALVPARVIKREEAAVS
jgi:hypothetical protein